MKSFQKHWGPIPEMAPYVMGLLMAIGLKYLYSRSTCEDLFWILGPTAYLVEWISGVPFYYDASAGFVNVSQGIAIAPACSGVNFLIIALIMSFFSFACHYKRTGRWVWLFFSLFCSYVLTLWVNSLRIFVSIETIAHGIQMGWLTPERIHRLEGVVVYFFCLSLFYLGMKGVTAIHDRLKKIHPPRKPWAGPNMVPLAWYILMVLIVPVLTGNYRDQGGRFVEHGIMVVACCSAVIVLFYVIPRLFFLPVIGWRGGKK
ncbi:MAG: exosortase K [Proteobacteria bacterium]|nr:exosortase K [Pseudomonadota bacterium]